MDFIDKKMNNLKIHTEKFLKSLNTDIDSTKHVLIIKSDKGNVTTIISKNTYNCQLNKLINDHENFISYRKDPTSLVQGKLIEILDKLVKKGQIENTQ
jgi:hypothetical protein